MTRYIINDFELDQAINHVYALGKLANKAMGEQWLMELLKRIKARQVPEQATHFAVIRNCSFSSYQEIPK